MEFELKNLLDKIDVLGELPFLVRKFVQTFVTAPFVYQWFESVEARIRVGGQERRVKGRVFHENTFLMQMPDSSSSPPSLLPHDETE
jgi:hypothetical protein